MNPKLARKMVEQSRQNFEELKGYGLEFTDSMDLAMVSCFGKTARGGVLNDLNQAVDAYRKQIGARPNIQVLEGITVFTLLMKDGACQGAVGFMKDGEIAAVLAPATVLACGGGENLYEFSYAVSPLNGSAYAWRPATARESSIWSLSSLSTPPWSRYGALIIFKGRLPRRNALPTGRENRF